MRDRGTFNFSASLEPKKLAPLDARTMVNTYAELLLEDTWKDTDNNLWIYNGMLVSVLDRPGKLYELIDQANYSQTDAWKEIGGEEIEIINNLTTDDATKPLSAAMGKQLQDSKAEIRTNGNVNLDTVNGYGILGNTADDNATAENKYPITQAGTLFYGIAVAGSSNQIYGTYYNNRWFARGSGLAPNSKTPWKEFLFKEDVLDSLTATETTIPLSANAGRVLKESINATDVNVSTKANASDVYSKSETYTKAEVDALIQSIRNDIANAKYVQSNNITTITRLTQAEYDAIANKDNGTMYAIIG